MQLSLPPNQSHYSSKRSVDRVSQNHVNQSQDQEKELFDRVANLKQRKNKQLEQKNKSQDIKESAQLSKVRYEPPNKMDSLKNSKEGMAPREPLQLTPVDIAPEPINLTLRFISHYTKPVTIFRLDVYQNVRDSFTLKTKTVVNIPTQASHKWHLSVDGRKKIAFNFVNVQEGEQQKVVIKEDLSHHIERFEDFYEGMASLAKSTNNTKVNKSVSQKGNTKEIEKSLKEVAPPSRDDIKSNSLRVIDNVAKKIVSNDDLVIYSEDEMIYESNFSQDPNASNFTQDDKIKAEKEQQKLAASQAKFQAEVKKSKIENFFERNNAKKDNQVVGLKPQQSRKTQQYQKQQEEIIKESCTFKPKISAKSKIITREFDPFHVRAQDDLLNRDRKIKQKLNDKYDNDVRNQKEEAGKFKKSHSSRLLKSYQNFNIQAENENDFDNLLARNNQWVSNKEAKIHEEMEKAEHYVVHECTYKPKTNKSYNKNINGNFMKRLDFDVCRRKNNIQVLNQRSYSTCTFKPQTNIREGENGRSSARMSMKTKYSKNSHVTELNTQNQNGPSGRKGQPTILYHEEEDEIQRNPQHLNELNTAHMKHKYIFNETKDEMPIQPLNKNSVKKMFNHKTEGDEYSEFHSNTEAYNDYDGLVIPNESDLRGSDNYESSVAKNLISIEKMKKECDNLLLKEETYKPKDDKSIIFSKSMKKKIKGSSRKSNGSPDRIEFTKQNSNMFFKKHENLIQNVIVSNPNAKPTGNLRIIYAENDDNKKTSSSRKSSNNLSTNRLRQSSDHSKSQKQQSTSNKNLFKNANISNKTQTFLQKHESDLLNPQLVQEKKRNNKKAIEFASKKESRQNNIYGEPYRNHEQHHIHDVKLAAFNYSDIARSGMNKAYQQQFDDTGEANTENFDQPGLYQPMLANKNKPTFKQVPLEDFGEAIDKNQSAKKAKVMNNIEKPMNNERETYEIYDESKFPTYNIRNEYGNTYDKIGYVDYHHHDNNDSVEIIPFEEDLEDSQPRVAREIGIVKNVKKSPGQVSAKNIYKNPSKNETKHGVKNKTPEITQKNSNRSIGRKSLSQKNLSQKNLLQNKSREDKSQTQVTNPRSSYAKNFDKKASNLNQSSKYERNGQIEFDPNIIQSTDSNEQVKYEIEVIDKSKPYATRKNIKK